MMRNIALTYHHEDGVWWVDSDDIPGFYAAADSLEDARKEAKAGVAFALGDDDFSVFDRYPAGDSWQSQLPERPV